VSADRTSWVTSEAPSTFGTVTDKDEYLHGDGPDGDALTETWYWGFNVPDARINCYAYCWVHPNLGVVSAGLFIYQGIKAQHLAAELFDMPAFLSAGIVGDGADIQVPNGLRLQVIDPLRHIHMTYRDPLRETEVDVHLTAVDEPIVRANNKHFEQVMRTRGRLVLRGERYEVDSYHVRDRSWGELRPEDHNPAPPYNWVTGVLDDGARAFNVGSMEEVFKDGWVRRDGRTIRLVHASKRVEREPGTLRPTHIAIEMHDAEGGVHHVTGEVVAGLPWGGWHNMNCHLGLVQWELDGRVGWGDSMDVQWNDYVWRYGQTETD
jgi:hypothetical protein